MKRCRIRVCLIKNEMKFAEVFSTTIGCSRNKFYGNFEIETMSFPHGCCQNGGWPALLISKTPVALSGFHPKFVLANSKNDEHVFPVEQEFSNFNQIPEDSVKISGKNFTFEIPKQDRNIIEALKEFNGKLYVTLYRESKQDYAKNMIEFNYEIHNSICHFCGLTKMNGYALENETATISDPLENVLNESGLWLNLFDDTEYPNEQGNFLLENNNLFSIFFKTQK